MKNNHSEIAVDQKSLLAKSACEIVASLKSKKENLSSLLIKMEKHSDLVEPDINAFDSFAQSPILGNSAPLHGLPITVKDQIAVAGLPRNFGLDTAAAKPCKQTASSIQKLIDAGATIIGKTNMPPYALDLQTFNKRAGRTNNPWNLDLTPGGSSGGGAAAVASGLSFLDIGADLSGSLRLPASYCGVYSLLPSEGAIENDGLMLDGNHLSHFARLGPITRSVEDLELAWSILSSTNSSQSKTFKFKIGVWDFSVDAFQVEEKVKDVFFHSLESLAASKFQLTKTSLDSLFEHDVYQTFGEIMGYETGAFIPGPIRFIMRILGKSVTQRSPNFLNHVYTGYRRDKRNYQAALKRRQVHQSQYDAETNQFDVVLLPVCRMQPFKHRNPTSERNGIRDYVEPFNIAGNTVGYLDALTAFTVPISLVGNPVVTIPIGLDGDGLPVGAQLVGKRGKEWDLLLAAKTLAKHLPAPKFPCLLSDHRKI